MLLKDVRHCDFSVLSMSVMGFQKEEVWIGEGMSPIVFFSFF